MLNAKIDCIGLKIFIKVIISDIPLINLLFRIKHFKSNYKALSVKYSDKCYIKNRERIVGNRIMPVKELFYWGAT